MQRAHSVFMIADLLPLFEQPGYTHGHGFLDMALSPVFTVCRLRMYLDVAEAPFVGRRVMTGQEIKSSIIDFQNILRPCDTQELLTRQIRYRACERVQR